MQDIQRLFVTACHEALANFEYPHFVKAQNEVLYKNDIVEFRAWLFNFFAQNRSKIFAQHHLEFADLLEQDWQLVKDLVNLGFASSPAFEDEEND